MSVQLDRVRRATALLGRAAGELGVPPRMRLAAALTASAATAGGWAVRSWASGDDLRGALSRMTTPLLCR